MGLDNITAAVSLVAGTEVSLATGTTVGLEAGTTTVGTVRQMLQTKGVSHAPADNTVATCTLSAEVGLTNYVTHISMSLDEGETTGVLVTLTNVKGTAGAITLTWYLPAGSSLSIDPPAPIAANAANLAMVLASGTPGASQQATVQLLGYSE